MVKAFFAAMAAVLFLSTSAQATRYHYRHHNYQHHTYHHYQNKHFATKSHVVLPQVTVIRDNVASRPHIDQSTQARPRDCYGIPWCGCWLRHQFGLADTSLNLAASWLRYSPATPQTANVVVWPNRHHVGKVLQAEGNRVLVISGNAGRNSGHPVWITVHRGFSFRKV